MLDPDAYFTKHTSNTPSTPSDHRPLPLSMGWDRCRSMAGACSIVLFLWHSQSQANLPVVAMSAMHQRKYHPKRHCLARRTGQPWCARPLLGRAVSSGPNTLPRASTFAAWQLD